MYESFHVIKSLNMHIKAHKFNKDIFAIKECPTERLKPLLMHLYSKISFELSSPPKLILALIRRIVDAAHSDAVLNRAEARPQTFDVSNSIKTTNV